jgi:hypothetical protein
MMSNARCWMPQLAVLAIATISLTACATGTSEPRFVTVCPPVVEYSRAFQARAADELDLLPDGSAIAEMLADYSVMRDQARACSRQNFKENRDAALTEWRELSA